MLTLYISATRSPSLIRLLQTNANDIYCNHIVSDHDKSYHSLLSPVLFVHSVCVSVGCKRVYTSSTSFYCICPQIIFEDVVGVEYDSDIGLDNISLRPISC